MTDSSADPDGHGPPRFLERLLLTAEEAAEVLHVGRTKVYALIRDGALRPVHIGRSCRLPLAELHWYVYALHDDPNLAAPAEPSPWPTPITAPRRRSRTATHQGELFG